MTRHIFVDPGHYTYKWSSMNTTISAIKNLWQVLQISHNVDVSFASMASLPLKENVSKNDVIIFPFMAEGYMPWVNNFSQNKFIIYTHSLASRIFLEYFKISFDKKLKESDVLISFSAASDCLISLSYENALSYVIPHPPLHLDINLELGKIKKKPIKIIVSGLLSKLKNTIESIELAKRINKELNVSGLQSDVVVMGNISEASGIYDISTNDDHKDYYERLHKLILTTSFLGHISQAEMTTFFQTNTVVLVDLSYFLGESLGLTKQQCILSSGLCVLSPWAGNFDLKKYYDRNVILHEKNISQTVKQIISFFTNGVGPQSNYLEFENIAKLTANMTKDHNGQRGYENIKRTKKAKKHLIKKCYLFSEEPFFLNSDEIYREIVEIMGNKNEALNN